MEDFVCFLFVVFYNVVLFEMAIIDKGDFDLFVDRKYRQKINLFWLLTPDTERKVS